MIELGSSHSWGSTSLMVFLSRSALVFPVAETMDHSRNGQRLLSIKLLLNGKHRASPYNLEGLIPLLPISRWGNWGTERWSCLLWAVELGLYPRATWAPCLFSFLVNLYQLMGLEWRRRSSAHGREDQLSRLQLWDLVVPCDRQQEGLSLPSGRVTWMALNGSCLQHSFNA